MIEQVWLKVAALWTKKSRSYQLRDFSSEYFQLEQFVQAMFMSNRGRLFHSLFNGNCDSNGCTDHRVVTHTQEAHHFNVCRY